jgi:type I restriction enzyme S subunit
MNIDKSKWKKVKFGDVCMLVNENTKKAKSDGLEYMIGLEHIEPNNLHLHSWDTTDKETTFTRIFRKGQVLFGRRRAYQRKVAYAEFNGICSGDIMVFKANEQLLLPKLLPFIVQSNGFYHCAIDTSAGSLSPRTKFNDLADYEFLLPPKSEQPRLAELLWAAGEVVKSEKEVKNKLKEEYNILLQSVMQHNYSIKPLSELVQINKSLLSQKTPSNYVFKYIDIASIVKPKVLGEIKEYMFVNAPSRARRIVDKNDIIVSMVRPYLKSFVQIKNSDSNFIASTGTAVLSSQKGVSVDYVFHTLFSNEFMRHCESRMTGTNYPAITPRDLGDFQIPVPDFNKQILIADKLNSIDDLTEKSERQIVLSQRLKLLLINKIF